MFLDVMTYLCCKQVAEVVPRWTFAPPLTGWCGVQFYGGPGILLVSWFIFNPLRCGGWRGYWGVVLHSGRCRGSRRPVLQVALQPGQRPRPLGVGPHPLARRGGPARRVGEVVQIRLVADG